jgi:hypothetical protein
VNINGISTRKRVAIANYLSLHPETHFILLIETKSSTASLSPMYDYRNIDCPHSPTRQAGGIALLCRSGLSCTHLTHLAYKSSTSSSQIETFLFPSNRLCIGVYRHPSAPISELRDMLSHLRLILSLHPSFAVVIVGDWNYVHVAKQVDAWADSLFLYQPHRSSYPQPTHTRGNLLDTLMAKDVFVSHFELLHFNVFISDHAALRFTLEDPLSPESDSGNSAPKFCLSKANWRLFEEITTTFARSIDMEIPPDLLDSNTFDKLYSSAEHALHVAAELSIPMRRSGGGASLYPHALRSLYLQMLKAKRAHRNHRRSNFLKLTFLSANKAFLTAVDNFHRRRQAKLLEKFGSVNSAWITLKIISGRMGRAPLPIMLKPDGSSCDNLDESLEVLNQFFCSVTPPDPTDLSPSASDVTAAIAHSQCDDNAPPEFMTPFSLDELQAALPKKSTSSAGSDNILTSFITHCSENFLQLVLLRVFNFSLKSGLIPAAWKNACIAPIYKKSGSRSLPSNYRPISLTSVVARLMERMISARMLSFIDSHSLLSDNQYGFRKKRSTKDCLLVLSEDLRYNLQKKSHTVAVFLDIQRAYDSVYIPFLLLKLSRLGFCGRVFCWLSSFLSNRMACTRWDNRTSTLAPVSAGVPQGSCLAPLLYDLFIDDLLRGFPSSVVSLGYADDVALYCNNENLQFQHDALQDALDWASRWALIWRVIFSIVKSKWMMFSRSRILPDFPSLHLMLQPLPRTDEFCYLGFLLDATFSGAQHLRHCLAKATPASVLIRQAVGYGGFRCPKVLLTAMKVMILPILEYAMPFWSPSLAQFRQMDTFLLRILKSGLSLPVSVTREAVFHEYDLLPSHLMFKRSLLKLFARYSSPDTTGGVLARQRFQSSLSSLVYDGPRKSCLRLVGNNISFELARPDVSSEVLLQPNGVSFTLAKMMTSWFHYRGDMTLIPLESAAAADKRLKSHAKWLYRFKRKSLYPRSHLYLKLDSFQISHFRSQLRLKCAPVNTFRHKLDSDLSPHCPFCAPSQIMEDIDHLLFVCPKYSVSRNALIPKFREVGIPFSVNNILLSDLAVFPSAKLVKVIEFTAVFLQDILTTRF